VSSIFIVLITEPSALSNNIWTVPLSKPLVSSASAPTAIATTEGPRGPSRSPMFATDAPN